MTWDIINGIVDDLFRIHSGTPRLRIGCALRPMLYAVFATVVMYSTERADAGEMNAVTLALRKSVKKSIFADTGWSYHRYSNPTLTGIRTPLSGPLPLPL